MLVLRRETFPARRRLSAAISARSRPWPPAWCPAPRATSAPSAVVSEMRLDSTAVRAPARVPPTAVDPIHRTALRVRLIRLLPARRIRPTAVVPIRAAPRRGLRPTAAVPIRAVPRRRLRPIAGVPIRAVPRRGLRPIVGVPIRAVPRRLMRPTPALPTPVLQQVPPLVASPTPVLRAARPIAVLPIRAELPILPIAVLPIRAELLILPTAVLPIQASRLIRPTAGPPIPVPQPARPMAALPTPVLRQFRLIAARRVLPTAVHPIRAPVRRVRLTAVLPVPAVTARAARIRAAVQPDRAMAVLGRARAQPLQQGWAAVAHPQAIRVRLPLKPPLQRATPVQPQLRMPRQRRRATQVQPQPPLRRPVTRDRVPGPIHPMVPAHQAVAPPAATAVPLRAGRVRRADRQ